MAIIKVIQISAETKQAQKALEEINLTIEQQEDLIKDTQRQIEKLEDLRDKTSKKDANRIKKYNEQIAEQNKNLKRTKTRLQENNKARTKENKVIKESVKEQREYTGVLGMIDKQTGGVISGFQGFTKSIGGATKGMKLLRIAWIATGIGAFVVVITSLIAAFTRSEEGQEKLQVGLKMLGAVVTQIMDYYAALGKTIIEVFTSPMKAFESFKNGFKKFIADPIGTVTKGFNDAKDAATNFIEETKKEIQVAGDVTKSRQKAHHIERALQVERAEANREINAIRLKAEDRENQTAAERIVLLRKAQKIEEDITAKEIEAKQLLVDAQILEMEQGLNNKQVKDDLAKMQAELINLDTKKLRSQRLLQTQITTALNEEKAAAAEKKKIADKKIEDDGIAAQKVIDDAKTKEQERLDGIKEIQDAFEAEEAERNAITEEEKATLEAEKEIADLDKLNATEEQKAKIIAYWNGQIQIGKNKDAKNDEARDKAVSNAKLDIAKQTMALIGEVAGRGSAVGKAMAIGQATISGIEGVQNAFKTAQDSPVTAVFPAYPFIQAGIAGAFSAIQIKKIASTKADGKGATPSPTVSGGGGGAIPSLPPSFNTVGASDTNQLASAIGQQEQQPVQAYVVSNDVTTAQGLERNIVEGATI
jgi:hypothetical protein